MTTVSTDRTEESAVARHVARMAARLFAQLGYDATPVRRIVEAAGVTKPTLYYHFGSKEGLAEALLKVPLEGLVATLSAIIEAAGDPVAGLERCFEAHFAFCREEPDRARFYFALWFGPHGATALIEELCRQTDRIDARMLDAVRRLAEANLILRRPRRRVCRGMPRAHHDGDDGVPVQGGRIRPRPREAPRGRPALGVRESGVRCPRVMTMTMRIRIQTIALGSGLLASLALTGCGHGGGEAEKEVQAGTAVQAVPVTVAPAEHRTVERTVGVVGTLKGWEEVTIGAKTEGRVLKVFHDMGDRVKPGELLVAARPRRRRPRHHPGPATAPGRAGQARPQGGPHRRLRPDDCAVGRRRPAPSSTGPGSTWPASTR